MTMRSGDEDRSEKARRRRRRKGSVLDDPASRFDGRVVRQVDSAPRRPTRAPSNAVPVDLSSSPFLSLPRSFPLSPLPDPDTTFNSSTSNSLVTHVVATPPAPSRRLFSLCFQAFLSSIATRAGDQTSLATPRWDGDGRRISIEKCCYSTFKRLLLLLPLPLVLASAPASSASFPSSSASSSSSALTFPCSLFPLPFFATAGFLPRFP